MNFFAQFLFLALGVSTMSFGVCSESSSSDNVLLTRDTLPAKTLVATEKNRSFDNAALSARTYHNAYLVQTHNTLVDALTQECRELAMVRAISNTAKPVQKTSEQKKAPTVTYTPGPVVARYCNNVRAPESIDQVKSMLRLIAAADERVRLLCKQAQPTYNNHKNPKKRRPKNKVVTRKES